MKLDRLEKLYVHELKDLYSAEQQVFEALPGLIEAAQDSELQAALRAHRAETRDQIERIEQIFENLSYEPTGHRCKGMEALLAEGKSALEDVPAEERDVRDAVIIAGSQRVEHYEIAGYGVARAYAEKLGRQADADLLTRSIEEEGKADRGLTKLAERRINFEAMHMA